MCTPSLNTATAETAPSCAPQQAGGPFWITGDCVDPAYNRPVVDSERDVQSPVPHHRVSGHFEGTKYKFNIYLPPKNQWQGRFFHKVYPLATIQDENASDETIAFGAESGAYTVQTNGDGGYRVDAAAAKFAKLVAASYYREPSRRIYGYVYGGSGGSFQTIGAIENTVGVWDGAVPFVPGVPTSVPNNFFIRAFARLILKDKAPQIADAVRPGGSGDPYAGLNPTERAVLQEVTKLGVPLRAWEDYRYLLGLDTSDGLLGFGGVVRGIDPTYADDFWSRPGYLGTEQSALGALVRAAKVDHVATITRVNRDASGAPVSLVLGSVPSIHDAVGLDFTLYDGATKLGSLTGSLDTAKKVFTISGGDLDAVATGRQLRIDNRWAVALTSYHRHQVPTRAGFTAWDQFRAPDGTPIYPQRPIQIGPLISSSTSGGGTHTGQITGKVIIVGNLLDVDAYPWHASWYAQQVQAALGDRFGDNFRIWYNDNADHLEGPVTGSRATRLIEYTGFLQQAVRDVSAWVERGVAPPRSSQYKVVDGQVQVPARATARGGIQPVVDLTANGSDHVDVAAGQRVTFSARIQAPPKTGSVVAAAWDFTGSGTYTSSAIGAPRSTVELRTSFVFTKAGTYFPALRATSQRDPRSSFGQAQNLGRVRVVVN
ncbi:Tat pathway signal sequence domain protein [Kribbella speibonae]|uniref:Tat pathway signal sequence domain protein n=1 Tax=Kribbella speibonae TaxID=1572660 RepID=A0A4R0IS25_9ACTN|nr:Tat pathway signal sequence domain protein [Kribbella speibonae]